MHREQQQSIPTLARLAAFADGANDDRGREPRRGIGQAYGHALDQGHLRQLQATPELGLPSQYLEQFGRKLLGGLLGQVARRYYAGGRQMTTALLRESFEDLLAPAKALHARYLPEIRQEAGTLDMNRIISQVRGI